jgi:hypothetical protein
MRTALPAKYQFSLQSNTMKMVFFATVDSEAGVQREDTAAFVENNTTRPKARDGISKESRKAGKGALFSYPSLRSHLAVRCGDAAAVPSRQNGGYSLARGSSRTTRPDSAASRAFKTISVTRNTSSRSMRCGFP